MTDLNNVNVMGRITHDPNEKSFGYIGNGLAKLNITIAVNRSVKKGDEWHDEASFFDVLIYGKTAENLKPYLTKGARVVINGHLHQSRWEKDGEKKSRIEIVADNVFLCGSKKDKGESVDAAPAPAAQGEEFPEDIPF